MQCGKCPCRQSIVQHVIVVEFCNNNKYKSIFTRLKFKVKIAVIVIPTIELVAYYS